MPRFKRWMTCALAAAALLFLAPGAAQAKWLKAESPRFILYGEGDANGLREYAEKLEIFDSMLRFSHGMDVGGAPPRKLEIYLVEDIRGLREVSPGLRETTAGFYTASQGDIFAMAIRDTEPDFVVLHEYAHHFMLQYFPYGYPAWLIEGYAEYFMNTSMKGDKVEVGRPNNVRAQSLIHARWIPMADVLGKTTSQIDDEDTDSFYAQSWALTHYLMTDPGRYKQLQAYMKAVGAGADPVKAMQDATGQDPAALEKILRAYAKGRLSFNSYTRKGFAKVTVTVTPLPDSADYLLLANQRMRRGMSESEGAEFMKTVVRPRTARYPGDRFADLTLAYGEVWFGDRKAGEAILQRLIAADAKDADALQLMGISRINQAADDEANVEALFKEAGRYLARAHAARPGDYKTLSYYAITRQTEPKFPSENTLSTLSTAYDLAPQVSSIRVQFARALMLGKEWEEARIILIPLANDPHGGGGAEVARGLLRQIDSAAPQVAAK